MVPARCVVLYRGVRIHVLSDLHHEMAPYVPGAVEADVVVLAGDIDKGVKAIRLATDWFPSTPVVMVAGNHEFYGGATPRLIDKMKAVADGSMVAILERDERVIDGVRFLGATMWTDFSIFGGETDYYMEQARAGMNDFWKIRVSPEFSRFSPAHALKLHRGTRAWLAERLDSPFPGPTVVVTHHAPSMKSCHPDHAADPLAAAFIVDLEELMGVDRVCLWIHGHTHHCVSYEIKGTRVVSNQRGYPGETVPDFNPTLVVEV